MFFFQFPNEIVKTKYGKINVNSNLLAVTTQKRKIISLDKLQRVVAKGRNRRLWCHKRQMKLPIHCPGSEANLEKDGDSRKPCEFSLICSKLEM